MLDIGKKEELTVKYQIPKKGMPYITQ